MPEPKPNLTGFDIRAYRNAAGSPSHDPWKRAESWRSTGPFTRFNRFRGTFPGFGIALAAFGGYLAYDYVTGKDEHGHGHGEGHGEAGKH